MVRRARDGVEGARACVHAAGGPVPAREVQAGRVERSGRRPRHAAAGAGGLRQSVACGLPPPPPAPSHISSSKPLTCLAPASPPPFCVSTVVTIPSCPDPDSSRLVNNQHLHSRRSSRHGCGLSRDVLFKRGSLHKGTLATNGLSRGVARHSSPVARRRHATCTL